MAMHSDHIPFHVKRIWFTDEESVSGGEFALSRESLGLAESSGLKWKFGNAELVREVIAEPSSVWRGLKRFSHETSFCYAGRPSYRLDEDLNEVGFPANRLFLAFVKMHYNTLLVFDWEFRESDDNDPSIPVHAEEDFEEKLWSRSLKKTR